LYLMGAFLAAICFGAATVFEAQAARASAQIRGIDPRLLVRLLRNWRFIVGVAWTSSVSRSSSSRSSGYPCSWSRRRWRRASR
jgi:hypothetical protein